MLYSFSLIVNTAHNFPGRGVHRLTINHDTPNANETMAITRSWRDLYSMNDVLQASTRGHFHSFLMFTPIFNSIVSTNQQTINVLPYIRLQT